MVCEPPKVTRPVSPCRGPQPHGHDLSHGDTHPRLGAFPHVSPIGNPICVLSSAPAKGAHLPTPHPLLGPPCQPSSSDGEPRRRGLSCCIRIEDHHLQSHSSGGPDVGGRDGQEGV